MSDAGIPLPGRTLSELRTLTGFDIVFPEWLDVTSPVVGSSTIEEGDDDDKDE